MRKLFLLTIAVFLTFSSLTFAQNSSESITGGRFLMENGNQNDFNARIETANFTITSYVNPNDNSVWNICSVGSNPPFCKVGTTFKVPTFPTVEVGFCPSCSPPQLRRGNFVLNGTTYQDVFFKGQLQFSTARFLVSPFIVAKRRGFARFTKPFTMTGNIQVCTAVNDSGCVPGTTIYNGQISGRGTLRFVAKIQINETVSPRPFLQRETIEYQFER